MALLWRIWLAITFVSLVVLTLFVGLATLQFGTTNSALVGKRLVVLAERTAAPFESAAKLGLPLSTVRNADALLERARQTDESILAIHVFDAAGRIVHSTMKPAPSSIPASALFARAAADGAPWHQETVDGFLSGVDIAARDGNALGGILVHYPGVHYTTRVWATAAELAVSALVVLLVGAVVGGGLLRFGLAGQIAQFESVDAAVSTFECDAWRSAAGRPSELAQGDSDDLVGHLEAVETRYRAAGRALGAGRDEVR